VVEHGELIVAYQTGILDDNLHVILDGYLGTLQHVLGLHVEEFAPPAAPVGGTTPSYDIDGLGAGSATEWGEVVRVHDAQVLSWFVGGFLDGQPAVTRRTTSAGAAWYFATAPENLGAIIDAVLASSGITVPDRLPLGVERLRRGPVDVVLNHTASTVEVDGAQIPPYGAEITPVGTITTA
jgi:beta-galactosidase